VQPQATTVRPVCRRCPNNERTHILRVLDAVSWNKKEAARVLAISRGTLYRKILESVSNATSRVSK